MRRAPTEAQRMKTLLTSVANMTKDGELDDDGHAFIMENDDAVETLHGIISEARGILGISDRPTEDD